MQLLRLTLSSERRPMGENGVGEKNNPSFLRRSRAWLRSVRLARTSAGAVVFNASSRRVLPIFSNSHCGHSYSAASEKSSNCSAAFKAAFSSLLSGAGAYSSPLKRRSRSSWAKQSAAAVRAEKALPSASAYFMRLRIIFHTVSAIKRRSLEPM